MNRQSKPQRPTRAGFTLIELLVVVLVIALLAALILWAAPQVVWQMKVHRAQSEMKALAVAIDEYYKVNNTYPDLPYTTNSAGLATLLVGGPKKYIDWPTERLSRAGFIDPWGNPYEYPGRNQYNVGNSITPRPDMLGRANPCYSLWCSGIGTQYGGYWQP